MTRFETGSAPWALPAVLSAALCLGLVASLTPGVVIALPVAAISLLPLAAHARWVGITRALTEPSAMTVIVIFYLFVFPLRGLAFALSDYENVEIVRHAVHASDLVWILMLASLGTTAMVVAFHFVRLRRVHRRAPAPDDHAGARSSVTLAAGVMVGIALAAIGIYIYKKGGLVAVQAEQISHTKGAALSGAQNSALSLWAILAVPSVWGATLVVLDQRAPTMRRTVFFVLAGGILAIQLIVFGSRLDFLLSAVGAWVIAFFSGRRVPLMAVAIGILLFIALSVPVLQQRPGGEGSGGTAIERFSSIAGYSVLDASLAVRQEPREVRENLQDSSRWTEAPRYLIPSAIWSSRQSLENSRMDFYVAQSLGTPAQRESGLPTTYITELWLYGGWLAVLVISLLFGAALGACHRRLIGSQPGRPSPVNLLWYGFVATVAFTYFKDGDILTTTVGSAREAAYFGTILLVCGVWVAAKHRRRGSLSPKTREPSPEAAQ